MGWGARPRGRACFMIFDKVKEFVKEKGLPLYRIGQIRQAVYEKGISDWDEATNLPADLRQELKKKVKLLSFDVVKVEQSRRDMVYKALFRLGDGSKIESVLMKPGKTWSAARFALRANWVLNAILSKKK